MSDAAKLAQSMLAGAGQHVRVDGKWGPESEAAWKLTSQPVREAIQESVLRNEGVSMDVVRRGRVNRSNPTVKRKVQPVKAQSVKAPVTAVGFDAAVRELGSNPTPAKMKGTARRVPPTVKHKAQPVKAQSAKAPVTAVDFDAAVRELGSNPTPSRMKGTARRVLMSLGYSASDFAVIDRQVVKESGWRWNAKEEHRYVTKRPDMAAFASWTMDEIRSLVRKGREAFFEAAYGYKTVKGGKLGNTQPGDGGKFLGRGLLQETGRWNMTRLSQMLGVDLISDPDWVIANPSNQLRAFVATVEKRFGARKGKLTYREVLANINPGLARG